MNSLYISFGLCALVLVLSAQSGQALECHICNSGEQYEGEACGDPLESDEFLFDCNEYGLENNFPEYVNASLCRKMYQTVQGESRIVRSCAQNGRTDRCVERTGTRNVKVTYCECEGKGCNTASAMTLPVIPLLLSACLALVMRS